MVMEILLSQMYHDTENIQYYDVLWYSFLILSASSSAAYQW